MRMFKIVGNWMRGVWLMGLGGLWLGMAYYLSGYADLAALGGHSMTPTVGGLLILGSLTFGAGLVIFVRGMLFAAQRAPLPKEAVGWRDDGGRAASDTGFDPDAALARYLERRMPAEPAEPEQIVPQRPAFGRKGV
jgi:hypothetical protein